MPCGTWPAIPADHLQDCHPYSPLKLFVPASALFFVLGCVNYAWTFMHDGRLTNGSTLMWSAAVIVFLIGLVSGQITALTYRLDA